MATGNTQRKWNRRWREQLNSSTSKLMMMMIIMMMVMMVMMMTEVAVFVLLVVVMGCWSMKMQEMNSMKMQ